MIKAAIALLIVAFVATMLGFSGGSPTSVAGSTRILFWGLMLLAVVGLINSMVRRRTQTA